MRIRIVLKSPSSGSCGQDTGHQIATLATVLSHTDLVISLVNDLCTDAFDAAGFKGQPKDAPLTS